MKKHHTIISGTGRTGTTFLVQLFTALNLDTGFTDLTSAVYKNSNAGMEWGDIRDPNAPYILKSPVLCDFLDTVMEGREVVIDCAIIPIRDLFSAAESRREVTRKTDPNLYAPGCIPGGLWHTDNPEHQEAILAFQFHQIIFTIAKHNIPMILLYFPRFVRDPEYLYAKIEFALNGIEYERFVEVFRQVARPELVHDFRLS